jgi:PAS domain S-box-containing protein
MNLNKIFSFLSIRTKLIIAFSLLSFIPLAIIGIIGVYNNINTMRETALENLEHDIDLLKEKTENFLSGIDLDLQLASNLQATIDYLDLLHQTGGSDKGYLKEKCIRQFQTFLNTKSIYYQLRLIDLEGDERFRITRHNSSYTIVPDDQLNRHGFAFYYLLSDDLEKGQIAFVPVELLPEHGKTVPAISFTMNLFNSANNKCAILIADVYADRLFQIVETRLHHNLERNLVIVNNEGNYLYHSEKKKDWNRLLATRADENLFHEYETGFTDIILSGKKGIIDSEYDEIAAYSPIFQADLPLGTAYFIFETVSKASLLGPVRDWALIFIGFIFIFLLLSVVFGMIATTQLAGPVRKLQRGAETISRGNYEHRISIQTNDEIEQLADQFNTMAGALADRENLLADHQRQLEQTVVHRTRELINEKEKMQAILDNVPSAFLLMDAECTVVSTSKAIKTIAGETPQKIMGQKCFELFNNGEVCQNCPVIESSERRTHSHIRSVTGEDGELRLIEHVSVPLDTENSAYSTLEILTDITEKKKLEQHLLKTEKLVATGEMSSVIAHELRNSLTSIKMILQLQRESNPNSDDQKSLDVAIQSIYRMEEVVNNLLRFARPSPYRFQDCDLNKLIRESLNLIHPQVVKKKIQLNENLQHKLPHLNLDPDHFKEALINILLNAIQAISDNGIISITSCLYCLNKRIEDMVYKDPMRNGVEENDFKIVLSKDSKVLKISITDNGGGIERDLLSKIFDPFFTTKLEGTGLGLAMAKRNINEHGGIITVESKPEQETTFSFLMPVGDTT